MIDEEGFEVVEYSDGEFAEQPTQPAMVPPAPTYVRTGKISTTLMRKLKLFPFVSMILEVDTQYRDALKKLFRGESLIARFDNIFNLTSQLSDSIDLNRLGISFLPAIGSLDWVEKLIEEFPINYVSENRMLRSQEFMPITDDVVIRTPPEKLLRREDLVPSSVVKKKIGIIEGVTGKYSKIGVLDSGAGRNRQYSLSNIQAETSNRFTIAVRDASGHGIHVETLGMGSKIDLGSGVILEGMAPGAKLFSGKCLFSAFGVGTDWSFVQMLVAALNAGATIINGSLGSVGVTDKNSATYKTMQEISLKGVKLVFAAGNEGSDKKPDSITSPADVEFCIAVGSNSITDGERSFYSSMGGTIKKPDIMSFGGGRADEEAKPDENILSSSSGAISKSLGGYKLGAIKGTSQATPTVSGTLADWDEVYYVRNGRSLTTDEVKTIFKENGHSWNPYEGYGELEFGWIYNFLK